MFYYYIRSYQSSSVRRISLEDFLSFETDEFNYVMMSAAPLEAILEEEFSY